MIKRLVISKRTVKIKLVILLKNNYGFGVSKFYHSILVGSGAVLTSINLFLRL